MKPALNQIQAEAVHLLQRKDLEKLNEFEIEIRERLQELQGMINQATNLVQENQERLAHSTQTLTKAVGAFENMADLLGAYYVKKQTANVSVGQPESVDVVKPKLGVTVIIDETNNPLEAVSQGILHADIVESEDDEINSDQD